jgi:phage terminase small subunit
MAGFEVTPEAPVDWSLLEQSAAWRDLTKQQQLWVLDFLVSGSALSATKAAYHASSDVNARVMGYELRKNKSIVAALDVAAGKVKTDRDILIETVQEQLKFAEKGSIAAAKLTVQLERLQIGIKAGRHEVPEPDEPSPARFKVGDICTQSGEKFRVTAIDNNGQVTEADEVE